MAIPVATRQISTTNGEATIVAEVLAPEDPVPDFLSRGS